MSHSQMDFSHFFPILPANPQKETQKEIGNPTRSCQLLDQWYDNHLNDAAWPASNKSKYVVLIGQMMHMFICFHLLNTPLLFVTMGNIGNSAKPKAMVRHYPQKLCYYGEHGC